MRTILFILSAIFLSYCNPGTNHQDSESTTLDEALGKYISQYYKGKVSVKDPEIALRFAGSVIDGENLGLEIDPNIISISPPVPGKFYWKDRATAVFHPDKLLQYDTRYVVTVNLKSLFSDTPDSLTQVTVPFITKPLILDMALNHLDYSPLEFEDDELQLSGTIKSSDYLPEDAVEKMLTIKQKNNSDLEVIWSHGTGSYHRFEINRLKRRDELTQAELEWDGKKWDRNFKGKRTLDILPAGEFRVIDAVARNGNSRSIEISFTNRLNMDQDITGLISISEYQGSLDYEIQRNKLLVYPSNINKPFKLKVHPSILNQKNKKLEKEWSIDLSFEPVKPEIKVLGKGVIVPNNDKIIFPFEAVNLKSAQVEIIKIYQENVLQFLQYNTLESTYGLDPVGRSIKVEDINLLALNPENNQDQFIRYALDLKALISLDPGAIYQIIISFDKEDVINYPCKEEPDNSYDYYSDDPCRNSYYRSDRSIIRNVLASNLAVVCKRNTENTLKIIVSDLRTVEPIKSARIEAYDFQKQLLRFTKTNNEGIAELSELEREPAFCIIKSGLEYGYINLNDYHSLSTSEFDVSGSVNTSGINGFIYGERGVWRPGDTLFLNFILEDKKNTLPKNHPVIMTVNDARGKKQYSSTVTTHVHGIYSFKVPTSGSDPTGTWTALVKVGNSFFNKLLKVETIKPNRLKITLDTGEDLALYKNQSLFIKSSWLHGASANGLSARIDMSLNSKTPNFKNYGDYIFYDPARKIDNNTVTILDGKLDENGEASVAIHPKKQWLAPGMLRADLNTKVFEKSGNFSEDNFSVDAHIYDHYVGIKLPSTSWGHKFVPLQEDVSIPVVALDSKGKPAPGRKLKVGIYRAEWNWWYDRDYSTKFNYNSSQHTGAFKRDSITTNKDGQAFYKIALEDYGNYMIRICDDESGHCTGDMFYSGKSWREGRDSEGQQLLTFITDKTDYHIGEPVKVTIPSNAGSKLLVSIESSTEVISTYWIEGKSHQTDFNIPTDNFGNKTIYIHVSLIQPHNNGENDLPIRMYGIVPVNIIDPATKLQPQISLAEAIRPNQTYDLKVTESSGKGMAYTIAIVDEGLLALTRHKTPNPWSFFYAKQSLGIKTWDIYDHVLSGYGGKINKWISIGGDADNIQLNKAKEANRFKAVVQHLGPFYLPPGKSKTHKIQIDDYVGEIRTMIVARNSQSYGSSEVYTKVKKPLMVQSTVPRVLGPNENLRLPINVFAMDKSIKKVTVNAATSQNLTITDTPETSIIFDTEGDKLVGFNMQVNNAVGKATIQVNAKSNSETASEKIELEIRNPSPYTSKVQSAVIQPGENWIAKVETFGSEGSNKLFLECSQFPSIDFGRRLQYLIKYPYGCIEQTCSAAFPQLYLDVVTELSETEKYNVELNIKRTIERLSLFQLSNGGMSYWPGQVNESEFGSVYAANFLIEAKNKGFTIPEELLSNLVDHLYDVSEKNPFQYTGINNGAIYTDVYLLYVLAQAGKPNIGAMNRIRNSKQLNNVHFHILSAGYALIGKKDVARMLIAKQSTNVEPYAQTGYSYGSHVRDMAMIAESLNIIGDKISSAKIIKDLASDMSSSRWYSTQTTSVALLAIGKFLKDYKNDNLSYTYQIGNKKEVSIQSRKTISTIELDNTVHDGQNISVRNTSKNVLFLKLVASGQLPPGVQEDIIQKHIKLEISYTDRQGTPIDISTLKQGTDFKAIASIQNIGSRKRYINEVALSQIFPSGWEIQNTRLTSGNQAGFNSPFEYQDIRDDRVNTFFDIKSGEILTFTTLLTASYAGKFYLPSQYVEAMYDNEIQAKLPGQWIEVH